MKKRLLMLASLVTALTLSSCAPSSSSDEQKEGPVVIKDKFIMENNVSTYSLVLSKNPQSKETFAASEFTYFMKEATNYSFPVITEKDVRKGQHYISLGFTEQFTSNFPNYDYSVLDGTQSGYFISTKDENIYIVASNDFSGDGVLYGIYDLLEDLINYRYYHDTEIYFEEKSTINLIDYKETFVNYSYDMRSISTVYTYTRDLHSRRMRLINNSRGSEWMRATWGHSQIQKILGPWMIDEDDPEGRTYGQTHPTWFTDPNMPKPASDGLMIDNCLNWCAGPEIERVVANKLIKFIDNEKLCKFVMCAQEDNSSTCAALPGVQEALDTWAKGSYSALQIYFMNHVIELVEEWVQKECPERELQYVIFAYHTTLEPPLDSNGNPVISCHEKLRIYIAPIRCNYSVPLSSPINKDTYRIFEGWDKAAHGKIIVYLYDLNYRMYFVNFNNFGSCGGFYQELLKYGIKYIMTQGVSDSNAPCFDEMRVYCESNLMRNVNLNYDDLAYDFIEQYYKDVAPQLKELYDMIRNRYSYYQTLVNPSSGGTTGSIDNTELYPLTFVRQMDKVIKEAFDVIEKYKNIDSEYYNLLYLRIMKEYLAVIYLKVKLYSDYFIAELDELKEMFYFYAKQFSIDKVGEGIPIEGALG